MDFKPLLRMLERIQGARDDSDTSLFFDLLYMGEMLLKLVGAGLVAAVGDDRERHRYRQIHRLVRADGLGEWSEAINEVLTGPPSQFLTPEARTEQKELTRRTTSGEWQFDAVYLLHKCIGSVDAAFEDLPTRVSASRWFEYFAILRNRTRGHGATTASKCYKLCPDLNHSIELVWLNHALFKRQWAYLHRNLSGNYRVTKLVQSADKFDYLKSERSANLRDGVYVFFDKPHLLELIRSDVDATDFLFPNGAFDGKRYELISYISDTRTEGDATPYLIPASQLPDSETQGLKALDFQGKCFGNLPPTRAHYIARATLERELTDVLCDDRHPMVSLVGAGGIGKTWLALSVLHDVCEKDRFVAILWFSARDIDLLPQGAKVVKRSILTERDIAEQFVELMQPKEAEGQGFNRLDYLASALSKSTDGPVLFVLDNFETVRSPAELFAWLDTYIRLPNKLLITSRSREFKADYPVVVHGMSEQECEALVDSTADALGIRHLLTNDYRSDLYHESDGHPYVIRVLLGEVAKAGKIGQIRRIVASKEEILDALFERTFSDLSPVAKRVFLTLCNWRSTVPQLAVEAVLLRPENERMDVAEAIEELVRSSFIELSVSAEDRTGFLTVPLVAAIFGERKLEVSAWKNAIEADTAILHTFGAAQQSDVRHGIKPRVERMFRHVATSVSQGAEQLDSYLPMLEFVARKYRPAWLLLASLYEESGLTQGIQKAIESVRYFLESGPSVPDKQAAWNRLASLCHRAGDYPGEVHALVEMCELPDTPYEGISNAANRVNQLFKQRYLALESDERQIVFRRLVAVMEERIEEADATDCSRLAWLCLHLHDEQKARQYTEEGLQLDSTNEHSLRLAERLQMV